MPNELETSLSCNVSSCRINLQKKKNRTVPVITEDLLDELFLSLLLTYSLSRIFSLFLYDLDLSGYFLN